VGMARSFVFASAGSLARDGKTQPSVVLYPESGIQFCPKS
jgi:hypothetical protein